MVSYRVLTVLALALATPLAAQEVEPETASDALPVAPERSVQERNKELARGFYQDLWFSDQTDRYDRYVAEQYVVHDIGDVKNVTEPAAMQRRSRTSSTPRAR